MILVSGSVQTPAFPILTLASIPVPPEAQLDNRRDVLIVEDDDCTRALLAAIVEHYSFRPTTCRDGASALHRLRTTGTGLLLLDLLLPHTNGFEVLRELKCTRPEMLRRTIVLTGASDRTLNGCPELEHVWKALRKPIDVTEFARELQACGASLEGERVRKSLGRLPSLSRSE